MTTNFSLYGCRKCFQKFRLADLSNIMQLCQNCENTRNSTTYKQCHYCNSDFKNSIAGDKCPKCVLQMEKHGEPSQCTICKMKMVFGNAVICIRCSHYRTKFGDPQQCENCNQCSAFIKDNISRQKVNGKVLCWLCTYYYKLQKSRVFKSGRDRNTDIFANKSVELMKNDKISEYFNMPRNDSSNSLLSAEPISKRLRMDEDSNLSMYSNDSIYNEQLLKVNSLQEEIKGLRKKVATKESELFQKDNQIASLKADMLQKDKDMMEREIVMKGRWENERENLMEKIRNLQRENINIIKSGKRKRPAPSSGLQYLTRNPLPMLPQSAADSPEVCRGGSVSKDVSSAEDSPR